MHLNIVYSVKSIERVAAEIGETIERIFDLAIGMETENCVKWMYCLGDYGVIAFTPFGIENLQERIAKDQDRAL